MSISTAPPKAISKLVSSAPLLLGIAAILSSVAQWRSSSSSDNKKFTEELNGIRQQVTTLAVTQIELNKNIATLQIAQSEDISRRKVLAELEYSSCVIEARVIEQRFGKAVADKYLLNRQRMRDEILKIEEFRK
jgi:methylthioribose-1-phosphate isomerase